MTQPVFSVIIPAYNEEKMIKRCIDSVLSQDDAPHYEIIIIDDGSSDSTSDIIQAYAAQHNKITALYNESNNGIVPTFNRGCKNASGEYLCFTGADTVLDSSYLCKVAKYANQDVDLILGYVKVRNTDNFHALAAHIKKEKDESYKYGGAAMTVRRKPFYETGMFKGEGGSVHQGEGQELIHRAERLGWNIIRDDELVVQNEFPASFREVFKRKWWAGYMYINYAYEHPGEISLFRRLAGGLYFIITTIIIIATLRDRRLIIISGPLLALFVLHDYQKAKDMYEYSGRSSFFLLTFAYDYCSGVLRFFGYLRAWKKVIGIAKKKLNHAM